MALKQDYARLINQVRTEMPGLSDAIVRQQLFPVFQQFFRETKMWQQDFTISVVPNQTSYTLVNPQFGTIDSLLGVLNSASQSVSAALPTITASGGTLVLRFNVNTAETMTATVSMNVASPIDKLGTPEIPDWVLNQVGDYIFEGICSRLMMQPNKPYSNPQLGSFHAAKFRQGIAATRIKVLHQNLWGANLWGYPQDFSVKGQRGGISTTGFGFSQ